MQEASGDRDLIPVGVAVVASAVGACAWDSERRMDRIRRTK